MEPISRRAAVRQLALVTPALLFACKSKPNCEDVSGLAPDDVTARLTTNQYTTSSSYPDKKCSGCAQYMPAAPNACGGCKVVKGPIDPNGWCKLWVAKPPQ
jgi:hypothetical protein